MQLVLETPLLACKESRWSLALLSYQQGLDVVVACTPLLVKMLARSFKSAAVAPRSFGLRPTAGITAPRRSVVTVAAMSGEKLDKNTSEDTWRKLLTAEEVRGLQHIAVYRLSGAKRLLPRRLESRRKRENMVAFDIISNSWKPSWCFYYKTGARAAVIRPEISRHCICMSLVLICTLACL